MRFDAIARDGSSSFLSGKMALFTATLRGGA
jgi:hypothetical protein